MLPRFSSWIISASTRRNCGYHRLCSPTTTFSAFSTLHHPNSFSLAISESTGLRDMLGRATRIALTPWRGSGNGLLRFHGTAHRKFVSPSFSCCIAFSCPASVFFETPGAPIAIGMLVAVLAALTPARLQCGQPEIDPKRRDLLAMAPGGNAIVRVSASWRHAWACLHCRWPCPVTGQRPA